MKKSLGAKTIAYPAPVFAIGTYDLQGRPNMMTAAWAGLCCSSPACIAVALRKATYSHGSIVERKAFTVNIPSDHYSREVDYIGLFSGKDHDKFTDTSLTPVRSDLVDAPYIEEFPVVLECRLIHTVELGLHTHFIGEILDVKADESVLAENGYPDITKVKPMLFAPGSRTYYSTGQFLGKAFSIGKDIAAREEK
jgi:flavin reductase (DIM6/NTAB) family NADH-FMN oxidoreductase RutF